MKILVIEDSSKHLRDAAKFFSTQHPEIKIEYVTSIDPRWDIKPGAFDGVISDIFFPPKGCSQEEPVGVAVMIICRELGIPCILNTTGYHHGPRYDWIVSLQRAIGLPNMVDATEDRYAEAETKNWAGALEALMRVVNEAE